MRTIKTSEKSVFVLAFLLAGLIFGLSLRFVPTTFADDEDSYDDSSYSLVLEDKFITIYDSEKKRTIKSDAPTVGEVLERLNISLDSSDSVSPSTDTPIDSDHFYINIYRSHPVLIYDGIVAKVANVSTYDARAAVRSAGFTLYDEDSVEIIAVKNFLETGFSSAYNIIRGDGKTITLEEDLPFSTETIKSYGIPVGSEEVVQLGELGKIERIYKTKTLDGKEVEKVLVSETVTREPVTRIVAVGTAITGAKPLTASMGRNRYTAKNLSGALVERQETFYDLPMSGVMGFCGKSSYFVRDDGVKIDDEGYILIAANLSRYPRCSVVETSLGLGKVYDTGSFATVNPEQFDIATDWSNHDGK